MQQQFFPPISQFVISNSKIFCAIHCIHHIEKIAHLGYNSQQILDKIIFFIHNNYFCILLSLFLQKGLKIIPLPTNTPVQKRMSAKEQVYIQLRDWIINGTLRPNEKINDQDISQYFSVSRTPVREAMQLLSDQMCIRDSTQGIIPVFRS